MFKEIRIRMKIPDNSTPINKAHNFFFNDKDIQKMRNSVGYIFYSPCKYIHVYIKYNNVYFNNNNNK